MEGREIGKMEGNEDRRERRKEGRRTEGRK